jgi:DNA polymerase III delta prime subunit
VTSSTSQLTDIVTKPKHGMMGWKKSRGRIVPYSPALGVNTYFSSVIKARINKQKPCNVIFCGEPGISKTYTAIGLAQYLEPRFTVKQIAMTYSEVMSLMINLPEGRIIVVDEPEYVAGHREWYKDVNRVLVSTLRSGRFKVHPLFIPTINKSLLDKTIRRYLIQYMVWMTDRGEGKVYRFSPDRFKDNVWFNPMCELNIEMLDSGACKRPWCYNCVRYTQNACKLLRAQYERKRAEIQDSRYKDDLGKVQKREAKTLTIKDKEKIAYELITKHDIKHTNRGSPDSTHLTMLFDEEKGLQISENTARELVKRCLIRHPELKKKES